MQFLMWLPKYYNKFLTYIDFYLKRCPAVHASIVELFCNGSNSLTTFICECRMARISVHVCTETLETAAIIVVVVVIIIIIIIIIINM